MEKIVDFVIKYKAVLIGIVVVLFLAMIASLGFMIYNQSLHIDPDKIAGVYGMNGKRNTKITFDNTTTEAVLAAVDGMKYDGSDKGKSGSYETYVCIEMIDGTEYRIKYCDSTGVYVTGGSARDGKYVNADRDSMADIIAITSTLEKKNGKDAESTSDNTSSVNQSASVNSVEQ